MDLLDLFLLLRIEDFSQLRREKVHKVHKVHLGKSESRGMKR